MIVGDCGLECALSKCFWTVDGVGETCVRVGIWEKPLG